MKPSWLHYQVKMKVFVLNLNTKKGDRVYENKTFGMIF